MIVNTPQALQQLQANIGNMTDEELRKVQIHIDGRIVFPNLINPRAGKANPNGRKTYGAVLVFPMGQMSQINQVGMTAIHSITERFKQLYHSNVPQRSYVRSYKNIQEFPTQDGGGEHPEFYQGSYWVNTSSGEKFKPKVFKKINGQITEVEPSDPDIYFGQKVIFVVTLYPTGTNPKEPEKKKGTNANLIGVLIVGGGEKIQTGAGQAEIDPNASFSAFASMTSDFSSGSVNPFNENKGQANQGQANNNPFGGGQQDQGYTPPTNNTFGSSQNSGPSNNNPFGNNGNNNNGGGNPFGGSLI